MTGTIRSLDSAGASGVIAATDGLIVGFRFSAVLAFDVPSLDIGQTVSFDLEDGRRGKAVNVCVQLPAQSPKGLERRPGISGFRYVGFQHAGNVRSYLFELLTPGEPRASFTVNGDLSLFTTHHVGLQEGPEMCLHLLTAELALFGAASVLAQRSLTEQDVLAHIASRPVSKAKRGAKRGPTESPANSLNV